MTRTLLILASFFIINTSFAQDKQSEAFSKSYEFEYNKEYKKAIDVLNTVYDANSYEINLRMGWLTYSNGDYLKSQTYYKNAMKINPKSIEAKLGYAYPTAAVQNWEDVIKIYNQILIIDSKNYTVNSRMANIYYNKKDYDKAKTYANIVYSLYPFDFSMNVLLGKINVSLGNITQAKTHLNKALKYDPTSKDVLALLKTL